MIFTKIRTFINRPNILVKRLIYMTDKCLQNKLQTDFVTYSILRILYMYYYESTM